MSTESLEALTSYRPVNKLCEPIYRIARKSLIDKKFNEAMSIFAVLVALRPDLENNWLGFAIAQEELNHMEYAQAVYEYVLSLNPSQEIAKEALKRGK